MKLYTVLVVPTGVKSFKKLPESVREALKIELLKLENAPETHGKKLKGAYSKYYSLHCKHKNIEYRIIYSIYPDVEEVVIFYAASRENFYKELDRLRL